MNDDRTVVKREFLSGTSRRITFQIIDGQTKAGFKPSTLTMSVYDVTFDPLGLAAATQEIVNGRNDESVIDLCDASGNVDVVLDAADTTVDVPTGNKPLVFQRVVLFTWTWASPPHTGKHEVILTIAPDREPEAT